MTQASLSHYYKTNYEQILEEWKTYLSFQSISADPNYHSNCLDCANWLVEQTKKIGLQSQLIETTGKPVVYAEYKGKTGQPTILFYGHYDVQPVDPIDLWNSEPFSPEIRGNRIYARGAQDNKGQSFYFLKAVEYLIANQLLSCSLKVFLEGEEETGSKGISKAIPEWTELLQGDVLMVCDTGAVKAGVPTITMGLRGILHFTVELTGIHNDLHSGSHGGMVQNPAMEMCRLLATLHDENGKIQVPGFYEGVGKIADADRALANAISFDPEEYKALIGAYPTGGEKEFTPVERKGFRPTIEVNGIHSGYGGPGSKTIIPCHALAKLSARLVGNQDPQHSLEVIQNYLHQKAPKDLKLTISQASIGGPAISLSSTSELIQKASQVLEEITSQKTVYSWEGGSIPVVASLAKAAKAEPLLVGFGLEEDRIHAPNESFDLEQFRLGFSYVASILQKLGKS